MASVKFKLSGVQHSAGPDYLAHVLPYNANDTLKGDFVLASVASTKDYGHSKSQMDKYGQYILTDSQKVKMVNLEAPLMDLKPGGDAYVFTYEDNRGKMVSFADMKGRWFWWKFGLPGADLVRLKSCT